MMQAGARDHPALVDWEVSHAPVGRAAFDGRGLRNISRTADCPHGGWEDGPVRGVEEKDGHVDYRPQQSHNPFSSPTSTRTSGPSRIA